MPTRKQVKRRRKRLVHGVPERAPQQGQPAGKSERSSRASRSSTSGGKRRFGPRALPVPSWQRSAKRASLLLAVLVVFYLFTAKNKSLVPALLASAVPAAVFVVFDYYLSRFLYQRMARRSGGGGQTPGR
jgi:hypothetical protein